MTLTLCIVIVVVTKEMHALEGLASPLFEGTERVCQGRGIEGPKVEARVISVDHARGWCLCLTSLDICVDGAAHTSCHVVWL